MVLMRAPGDVSKLTSEFFPLHRVITCSHRAAAVLTNASLRCTSAAPSCGTSRAPMLGPCKSTPLPSRDPIRVPSTDLTSRGSTSSKSKRSLRSAPPSASDRDRVKADEELGEASAEADDEDDEAAAPEHGTRQCPPPRVTRRLARQPQASSWMAPLSFARRATITVTAPLRRSARSVAWSRPFAVRSTITWEQGTVTVVDSDGGCWGRERRNTLLRCAKEM